MVPLTHLWLPILLATALMFVASSLVHMVVKWHASDYRALPNEDAVMAAIRKGAPTPGQYYYPYCADMKEMSSEAMKRKFDQGPIAVITLSAAGRPPMGRFLGHWFLFLLALSFCVAYLASRTLPVGTPYLQVFRVAGTVAFLAHAAGTAPPSIWMGKPWKVTFKEMADGLLYALVTAGAFGWLWPRV